MSRSSPARHAQPWMPPLPLLTPLCLSPLTHVFLSPQSEYVLFFREKKEVKVSILSCKNQAKAYLQPTFELGIRG